jgi:hypothetical protein
MQIQTIHSLNFFLVFIFFSIVGTYIIPKLHYIFLLKLFLNVRKSFNYLIILDQIFFETTKKH